MEMVKRLFMFQKYIDCYATRYTHSQARYINDSAEFISREVAKNGDDVIFDHTRGLCSVITCCSLSLVVRYHLLFVITCCSLSLVVRYHLSFVMTCSAVLSVPN